MASILKNKKFQVQFCFTKNKENLINTYFENTTFILAQVDKIAFGSRSMADAGLIGEFTGTAGAIKPPMKTRGEFVAVEKVAGLKKSTNGISRSLPYCFPISFSSAFSYFIYQSKSHKRLC